MDDDGKRNHSGLSRDRRLLEAKAYHVPRDREHDDGERKIIKRLRAMTERLSGGVVSLDSEGNICTRGKHGKPQPTK